MADVADSKSAALTGLGVQVPPTPPIFQGVKYMAKYRTKTKIVEAIQWFKNGDHPEDDCFRPFEDTGIVPTEPREGKVVRYYRYPGISDELTCPDCGIKYLDHGFIDDKNLQKVCPGGYLVTENGRLTFYHENEFKEKYEEI
jgi:hypothetical protein